MATTAPVFQASGLASGLNDNSIIQSLVQIASIPLTSLQTEQTALQSKVSLVGTLMSNLASLQTAADDLGTNGVLATKVTSANSSFTATAGTSAAPGSYNVRVDQLALGSKWLSSQFASPTSGVLGGSLQLTVAGQTYSPINIADGTSLTDVAYAINQLGAPISATVLTNTTGSTYLSVSTIGTGYTGTSSSSALSIAFTPGTGGTGQNPGFTQTQAAQNASFNVDGLQFTRQSNVVSDAIPGVTLTLNQGAPTGQTQGTTETLALATDVAGTQARLQTFVSAYNGVMSMVQTALNPTPSTDRSSTLTGDFTVQDLGGQLQSLITTSVPGVTGVSTLADLGVQSDPNTGALSIDTPTLTAALQTNPQAANQIFSTASSGLQAAVDTLVSNETFPGTGFLALDQAGFNTSIQQLTDQQTQLQTQIATYQQTLVAQFTAMETTISSLKSSGSFLAATAALPGLFSSSSTSSSSTVA